LKGSIRCRVSATGRIPELSIRLVPEGSSGDDTEGPLYNMGGGRSEFRIPEVPAGSYRVLLLVANQVRARAGPIEVTAGKEAGPVDLTIE